MLQMLLLAVPEADDDPEAAKPFLETFLDWVEELFYAVAEDGAPGGDLAQLFVPELITLMPGSLAALRRDRQFERAREATVALTDAAIRDHGLYGAQLLQKIATINHWYSALLEAPTRRLFELFCKAVDNLLDSFLKALGIGDAIKEIKEAMLGAVAWQIDDL